MVQPNRDMNRGNRGRGGGRGHRGGQRGNSGGQGHGGGHGQWRDRGAPSFPAGEDFPALGQGEDDWTTVRRGQPQQQRQPEQQFTGDGSGRGQGPQRRTGGQNDQRQFSREGGGHPHPQRESGAGPGHPPSQQQGGQSHRFVQPVTERGQPLPEQGQRAGPSQRQHASHSAWGQQKSTTSTAVAPSQWGNQGQQKAPAWGKSTPVQTIPVDRSSQSGSLPVGTEHMPSLSISDDSNSQRPGGMGQVPPRDAQSCATMAHTIPAANWKMLPENKDDLKLPILRRIPDAKRQFNSDKITIVTNHFPLEVKLPNSIFRYEVVVARVRTEDSPLPKKAAPAGRGMGKKTGKGDPQEPGADGDQAALRPLKVKRILQKILKCGLFYLTRHFQESTRNPIGIVSDFVKVIYSTQALEPIGLINTLDMSNLAALGIPDPDPLEIETGKFTITLTRTDWTINLEELRRLVNNTQGQYHPVMDNDLAAVYNCVVKLMPNYIYMAMGRSLLLPFPRQGEDGIDLGGGLTCWPGLNACITPGWKYFLNISLGYSTMRKGDSVLAALMNFFESERIRADINDVTCWRDWQLDPASKFLHSAKVRYEAVPGHVLGGVVNKIHHLSPSQAKFVPDGGREITVKDYYMERYHRRLEYPNGPLLVFQNARMVPAELCIIKEGQSVNRMLNDNQTRGMLEIARKRPADLERDILHQAKNLRLNQNETFQKFGITVSDKMLQLQCRVLGAPDIAYRNQGREVTIQPSKGVWQNPPKSAFNKPASEEVTRIWGILILDEFDQPASAKENFVRAIVETGAGRGMRFSQKPIVVHQQMNDYDPREINVELIVRKLKEFQKSGCTLVFVQIPRKQTPLHGQVKEAAELGYHGVGMMTQCIQKKTFSRFNASIIQQLLTKLNGKLDGVCHQVIIPANLRETFQRIDLPNLPEAVLVMGADVTHPTPGTVIKNRKGETIAPPSYASVTGSIDRTCMPYMMHIQAQRRIGRGAAEVIYNMGDILEKMLLEFFQRNNTLPGQIIYYRDGVGDGQFKEVLHVEMAGMREACSRFDKMHRGVPYQPKITVITVQKRHKTRILYKQGNRTDNAPPGTVIDEQIVHPTEHDFYLLSHAAIQGTSRPTRYHVLWDDSDFTQDEIQLLTFYLCHMYARCNRSVKIPAPTYYSHWAATRAKELAAGFTLDSDDLSGLNDWITREPSLTRKFPMHFI